MIIENQIKELLEQILNRKVSPNFTIGPYPAVAYKITPISGGLLKESQLEVRIIGSDYDELLQLKQTVIDALDMPDATYKRHGDMSYHSELAGGGDLFNDQIQMWECISLYIMTWR